MSRITWFKESRNSWKTKAVERAKTICYLLKENRRIKNERDTCKKQLKGLQAELLQQKELQSCQRLPSDRRSALVFVCLQLFLVARISFRAVSRVLKALGKTLGFPKAPCPQTVINWVSRLSLTRIQNAAPQIVHQRENLPLSNGKIWLIDACIGLGSGKILAILALDGDHHAFSDGAPTLQQVSCVAVAVSDSWTGEKVVRFLKKVIASTGRPIAYLKDGGTDLAKATRLLSEQGEASLSIDDISHIVANLLKHEYQEHPQFENFLSCCGKASKNLKQTVLAFLAPPKISIKARFMNLQRLVRWADQVLRHSPKGRAPKNSLLSKLRTSLNQLPDCRAFINRFLRDARPLLECQKVLKMKGLSYKSYAQCQPLIEKIPPRSPVRIGFTNWAKKQLEIAEQLGLGQTGMPISSDNIESLFAIAKQHGTGEIKDAYRMAIRLPALCGLLTKEDAERVSKMTVKEQQEMVPSFYSLTQQRQKINPNPGSLDNIQPKDVVSKKFELIPHPKNEGKIENNSIFSVEYSNVDRPIIDGEIHEKSSDYRKEDTSLIHGKTHVESSIEDELLGRAA